MAETLQMRYSAMKKSLNTDYDNMDRSKVGALLNETREQNIALNTEVENLRQKVMELQGDLKALRSQNQKCNCSTINRKLSVGSGFGELEKRELEWNEEKSKLILQMENMKKKVGQ